MVPPSPFNNAMIHNYAKEESWTVDDVCMRTWKLSGFHYGGEHVVKFIKDGYAPGGVLMINGSHNDKLYRWSFKEQLTIYDEKGK
jgi:hypothetical protein